MRDDAKPAALLCLHPRSSEQVDIIVLEVIIWINLCADALEHFE